MTKNQNRMSFVLTVLLVIMFYSFVSTNNSIAATATRFTDNGNGTVTDNTTNLVWLKDANCTDTVGGIDRTVKSGFLTWTNAITWSDNLSSGACGLSDGSTVGQWRLPNRRELQSLFDRSFAYPALTAGHPFTTPFTIATTYGTFCWTSSTYVGNSGYAWLLRTESGLVVNDRYSLYACVWPVRDGL